MLVASIIAVVATLPRAPRPGAQAHAAASAPRSVTYANPGGLFRISHPRAWRPGTDADGGLVLQAGGQDAVGVKEFTLASRVDTHNLRDMRAVTDAVLSTPTAHLTVLATQVVHVGSSTGLFYLYSFPSENPQGVHAHYFLFSGNRMFTVVCPGPPGRRLPGAGQDVGRRRAVPRRDCPPLGRGHTMNARIVGDLLGALVLVPALAITFGRMLVSLRAIASGLELIIENTTEIVDDLHAIPRLAETEMLTGAGLAGVARYTSALEQSW